MDHRRFVRVIGFCLAGAFTGIIVFSLSLFLLQRYFFVFDDRPKQNGALTPTSSFPQTNQAQELQRFYEEKKSSPPAAPPTPEAKKQSKSLNDFYQKARTAPPASSQQLKAQQDELNHFYQSIKH